MNLNISDICICGHNQKDHAPEPLAWCPFKCFTQHPKSTYWQHHFKLDNLSYLEQLYEAKHK